jgi:ABC-type multidrug transport system permease subunit
MGQDMYLMILFSFSFSICCCFPISFCLEKHFWVLPDAYLGKYLVLMKDGIGEELIMV